MNKDNIAIRVSNLSKCYHMYDTPRDRLKQFVVPALCRVFPPLRRLFSTPDSPLPTYYREFWSLKDVSFEVKKGDVLGIIGKNGAGKSTLLQILCGTLTPTAGAIETYGRVAALLELGAGFNPEFTGRENVYMNASVLGLSNEEIDARFDEIVAFADIGFFIDQPVKTYSSGMFVRLAFSIATSVDPDILVIDEALSVGDGAFARKSFDRIMALMEAGKTILFCSHSMYQVDVLCQRVVWLEHGKVRMLGSAAEVTSAYNTALALEADTGAGGTTNRPASAEMPEMPVAAKSTGRIDRIHGACDGKSGDRLAAKSLASTVSVTIEFVMDPALPMPSVALGIENAAGVSVSSVISIGNMAAVSRDRKGQGRATVIFPQIPLLKGEYRVTAFLACDQGLYVYDIAPNCLTLDVSQDGAAQGVVQLPHEWRIDV